VSATLPPPPPGLVWGPALLEGDPPAWCAVTDKGPHMYRHNAWVPASLLDAGPIYHAAFETLVNDEREHADVFVGDDRGRAAACLGGLPRGAVS
jgi:hypothetical protein